MKRGFRLDQPSTQVPRRGGLPEERRYARESLGGRAPGE